MESYRQYKRIGDKIRQKQAQDVEKARNSDTTLNETATQPIGEPLSTSTSSSASSLKKEESAPIQRKKTNEPAIFVTFDGPDDPENPKNWGYARKWLYTVIVGGTAFLTGWAAAIDAAISQQASEEFGVSAVTESLATGLFLVAFGISALFNAPFSETVGRNPVYVITLILFMIFTMAAGLAPNIGAQLAFRFLAGFFGGTPLTTFGGSVADLWYPLDRTIVFPATCCVSFVGPFIAPLVGSFIGQSTVVEWQWTEWTTLILAAIVTGSILLFLPETYAPVILEMKAHQLRKITGNTQYTTEFREKQESLPKRLAHSVKFPFVLFRHEIMVVMFTLYLSIVYIVLFTFLTGYDFIYARIYGFSQGQVGLTWIGINIGFLLACVIIPFVYSHYKKKYEIAQKEGKSVAPEERLWYAMIGAPWFPISLFWMAWTSRESVSFWVPLASTIFFGFSTLSIFITSYQYLIDAYELRSASALAGATFARYIVAGGMVVVSIPMYSNLGVDWTLTLLGCLALLMTPVPYVFYIYGERIRTHSKHAKSP